MCSVLGRSSQTEQYPCISRPSVGGAICITRRHHPLEGQVLEVVRCGKSELVVRHPDSLTMWIPRAWTDADGVAPPPRIAPDTQLTLASLRDLMRLVDAVGDRV